MKYFVLKETGDETNVYVDTIPSNIEDKYQLLKGISRLDGWPIDISFQFSDDRPEGMTLTDYVENPSNWLIISTRFKKVLEESGAQYIEYLPVQIKNHKGRIASKDYWIANFFILCNKQCSRLGHMATNRILFQ